MKTTIKNTLQFLFLFFIGTATLASCSKRNDNDYKEYKHLIIGGWSLNIETYFQENGKAEKVLTDKIVKGQATVFYEDGQVIINFDVTNPYPYSIVRNKLSFKGNTYTITKLDEENIEFEGIEGQEGAEEYKGEKGTFNSIYKGQKGL